MKDAETVAELKVFYATAAGWSFEDWGPTYAAFTAGVAGGFNGEPEHRTAAPLVILETNDLEAAEAAVREAGGTVTLGIFTYPGGRRVPLQRSGGKRIGDDAGGRLKPWRLGASLAAVMVGVLICRHQGDIFLFRLRTRSAL